MAQLSVEIIGGLRVQKRHPLIGAEVQGLDLSEALDSNTVKFINSLWLEHLLLIFPNQAITDEQHIAFGRHFGELEIHPSLSHRSSKNKEIYRVSNVSEDGKIIPSENTAWQYLNLSWLWHTDSSFREIPSKGSILHGIETTNAGGNTLFANMYAAYEDLPIQTKQRIENLYVWHDHDFIIKQSRNLSKKRDRGTYDRLPPVLHPLVHVHQETNRKSLFLSPHTMDRVDGLDAGEGRELLDDLIAHAIQPRYVYRHRWEKNDVIMWDNRCTMHSVEPFDNANVRREMHRVTLMGEGRPIPAY